MTPLDKSVTDLLDQVGATLIRDKKHLIYEMPNGQKVTLSKTTVNRHATEDAIHEIRRAAGLQPMPKVPVKRVRSPKPGRHEVPVKDLKRDLREALVAKQFQLEQNEMLRDQIKRERREVSDATDLLESELKQSRAFMSKMTGERNRAIRTCGSCWWCRLKAWWHAFNTGEESG